MKKLLLGLVGIGLLGACSTLSGGFSAFNLTSPKEACVLNTDKGIKELNMTFNFLGTIKNIKFTFTPNGKSPVIVNAIDLDNPPSGLRLNFRTTGEAKLYVDLNSLTATNITSLAIPKPDVKEVYPMDITLDAVGSDSKTETLTLRGIDVANCY